MQAVYLDNNATTRVLPDVLGDMLPYFTEQFGNPSSAHGFGPPAQSAIRKARGRLKALLGISRDDELIFTSGGTESNNTAILSALSALPERSEIITTAVEHPSILSVCADMAVRRGIRVHHLPVDGKGRLDKAVYEAVLSEKTALVSIMWANNETGTIFPVTELAELAKQAGALFHTDAVQAVGRLSIDLGSTSIDMLSLSGHKLHAPKGIGALYLRRGTPFASLLKGGRQERGRRAGTENIPAIVGLGKAAELASASMTTVNAAMGDLRDYLEAGILRRIPGCSVVGDTSARLPNTSAITFEGVESDAMVLLLARKAIGCSAGSACTAGSMEPSHVLRAMAFPDALARGSLRFSLSRETTMHDVERLLVALPTIVASLRRQAHPATGHQSPNHREHQEHIEQGVA